MPYDPHIHHRRSIRLKGYDYTQPGAYFVTLVTYERQNLFGEVVDGMRVNHWGHIVQQEWGRLAQRFDYVRCDAYVVMPNHVHGVLMLHKSHDCRGVPSVLDDTVSSTELSTRSSSCLASNGTPLPERVRNDVPQKGPDGMPNGPAARSLGALMAQFKSRITKRIWAYPDVPRIPIWQRDYYEHIVRNDVELDQIRRYIQDNPLHWIADYEDPVRAQSIRPRQG